MVFEVCRSLTLDKTNLFFPAFLPDTGLAFGGGGGITDKRTAILIKEVTETRTLHFKTRANW